MHTVAVLLLYINPMNAVWVVSPVVGPVLGKTSQLRRSARCLGTITLGRRR